MGNETFYRDGPSSCLLTEHSLSSSVFLRVTELWQSPTKLNTNLNLREPLRSEFNGVLQEDYK